MKRLIITTIFGAVSAIALGFGLIPSMEQTAFCDSCGSAGVANARKIYEKFNGECARLLPDFKTAPKKCFDAATYDKIFPAMQTSAKSHGFGRGTEVMFIGESRTDTLLALGKGNTYLTGAPSNRFTLGVVVKKEKGASGLQVKVCSIDRDGKQTLLETFEVKEDEVSKGVPVAILKGDIIQIEVSGFGKLFSRAKYTLQLNKPS